MLSRSTAESTPWLTSGSISESEKTLATSIADEKRADTQRVLGD